MHTHLAENSEDIEYSLEKFNMRPGEYAQSLGWLGDDVWHAHCVQLDSAEVELFGETNTGIAHCPSSNMRLASGIAPLLEMLDNNVRVGLGVDGSSSNDSSHMLNEARQAMLLQRVVHGASAIGARDVLRTATRGGAEVLRRGNIGQIAPGFMADLAIYDTRSIDLAGTHSDPLAALVFCGPIKTTYTIINGKLVVKDGQLTTTDLNTLLQKHRALSIDLVNSA
jgi:cytosine/adenosine deaminase-related metal-dependent hydrolase